MFVNIYENVGYINMFVNIYENVCYINMFVNTYENVCYINMFVNIYENVYYINTFVNIYENVYYINTFVNIYENVCYINTFVNIYENVCYINMFVNNYKMFLKGTYIHFPGMEKFCNSVRNLILFYILSKKIYFWFDKNIVCTFCHFMKIKAKAINVHFCKKNINLKEMKVILADVHIFRILKIG